MDPGNDTASDRDYEEQLRCQHEQQIQCERKEEAAKQEMVEVHFRQEDERERAEKEYYELE